MTKQLNLKNSLILLLTATIWGVAFVAQSVGMDYVGPFTFNGTRSVIGGIVLLPVIAVMNRGKKTESTPQSRKTLIIGGILCGIFLCFASAFQQIGIKYTTSVGKAGFITACYIILVPIIQQLGGVGKRVFPSLFKGYTDKKVSPLIWLAVVMTTIGLYLLCITDGFSVDSADILVFICAVLFAFHIMVIDYFSPKTDGVKMSCIQFFVCGLLSFIAAFAVENVSVSAMLMAWKPILYAGALSSGVGYTLQIVGQKNMNPTVASLILSLESCISVLASWLLLGQKLGTREIFGCVIMFAAIVLAQLPSGGSED